MFKRQKNKKSKEELLLQDELVVETSQVKTEKPIEKSEPTEISSAKPTFVLENEAENLNKKPLFVFKNESAPEQNEPVFVMDKEEVKEEVTNSMDQSDSFIWTNTEEYELKQAKKKPSKKEQKQAQQVTKKPQTTKVYEEPKKTDKVDLNSFFEASSATKKLKRRDRKKYSKKELKRRKKRANKTRTSEDIKNQKVYKFRKKKYTEVADFIAYLNDHYLDIDDVAHDVLSDENFFGWISKKSGMFDQSLKDYQEILAKIEKKK